MLASTNQEKFEVTMLKSHKVDNRVKTITMDKQVDFQSTLPSR